MKIEVYGLMKLECTPRVACSLVNAYMIYSILYRSVSPFLFNSYFFLFTSNMYIDANGNIVKRKPNNQPRSNPRRNVGRIRTLGGNREENNNEGTWGSGSSTAQGFTARSGNENPRGNGGGRRNGGFVASIERMLGITGRTVTIPGMDRPIRLIYLIFVALVGVVFGWKAVLGIAALYFIQQRSSSSNRTQQ